MFAAVQVLKSMFVSVLDCGNIFLAGENKNRLSDLLKLQNDAIRCCLEIKIQRDAYLNNLHVQLKIHLLDHRRTVQLLTCVKKAIENNSLPHINIENAYPRNQGLKVITPIK